MVPNALIRFHNCSLVFFPDYDFISLFLYAISGILTSTRVCVHVLMGPSVCDGTLFSDYFVALKLFLFTQTMLHLTAVTPM